MEVQLFAFRRLSARSSTGCLERYVLRTALFDEVPQAPPSRVHGAFSSRLRSKTELSAAEDDQEAQRTVCVCEDCSSRSKIQLQAPETANHYYQRFQGQGASTKAVPWFRASYGHFLPSACEDSGG